MTPEGKWLVAIKWENEGGKTIRRLIRRNLKSGEEFSLALPQNISSDWLIYVPAHGKVLALNYGYYGKGNQIYLLDHETGTVQPVKGEFRPLTAPRSRAPQSAGAPNLFWEAIYDWEKKTTRFGRYDTKNFFFTCLLEFTGLE